MPEFYDDQGRAMVPDKYGTLRPDLNYHRYESGVGDECKACGNNRFAIAHFNGDKTAADLARKRHHENKQNLERWRSRLKVSDRVQISDNHPREEYRGRTGTVVQFTSSSSPIQKDRIVSIKMVTVGKPAETLAFPAHFLIPPQVQVKVPKFDSPEEADRWLEDTAKEMGIVPERDTPYFATKEEADEWLAQQERIANKEPWVPPSWQDHVTSMRHETSERWAMLNPVLAAGEVGYETDTQVAKIGDGATPWKGLPKVGQQPPQFILDEAADSVRAEVDKRIFDLLQEAIPPGSTGASEANAKLTPDDIRATVERLATERLGIQVTKPEDIIRITGI